MILIIEGKRKVLIFTQDSWAALKLECSLSAFDDDDDDGDDDDGDSLFCVHLA